MFKWTDINKIKIIIIPANAIFLYFSNKTPIPNMNSRIPSDFVIELRDALKAQSKGITAIISNYKTF